MRRGQGVVIGSGCSAIVFKSQKEALGTCKEMLARYNHTETTNEQDSEFLRNLIQLHPDAVEKIGRGMKRFSRTQLPNPPTQRAAFGLSE